VVVLKFGSSAVATFDQIRGGLKVVVWGAAEVIALTLKTPAVTTFDQIADARKVVGWLVERAIEAGKSSLAASRSATDCICTVRESDRPACRCRVASNSGYWQKDWVTDFSSMYAPFSPESETDGLRLQKLLLPKAVLINLVAFC